MHNFLTKQFVVVDVNRQQLGTHCEIGVTLTRILLFRGLTTTAKYPVSNLHKWIDMYHIAHINLDCLMKTIRNVTFGCATLTNS